MLNFFRRLFFTSDFMPHGHCYLWQPGVLWLHVVSDALIALAYFSIPVALLYFVRRRRSMAFDWIFVMFGVFICACGITHVFDVVTVWYPVYRLMGLSKAFTAAASLFTAASLWKIVPRLLAMPSPRQLQASNRLLQREIAGRKAVEEELRRSHQALEERVEERTAELRTEIFARQQAEEEVRASQQQLKNILDYAPLPIFLKDRAGRYLQANRAFASAYGVQEGTMLGKTSAEMFPAETVALIDQNSEQVFTTGEAREFEEIIPREDGPHTFLSTRFLLPGLNGAPDTLGVISRDVTERKRAEGAIQQAREEAERANNAKSEFLSRMSHELRTPLNAILGFGQLLEMANLTNGRKESVGHILKAGRHLLDLIDEVLAISRIEAGRMQLSLEPVALGETVRECLSLVTRQAADRQVRLVDECSDTAVHVLADRQRLRQVLLNLLSNAIKYNRAGGSVTLSRRETPGTGGEAIQRPGASFLRLAVADTGHGLSAGEIGRLFTPFERLNAERSPTEGTGLGLALSKGLVETMHGRIGVDSVSGEGCTFWIELPLATDPQEQLEREGMLLPGLDTGALRGCVLYVEDNLSNLRLIEMLLREYPGLDLLSAQQGALGLEIARARRPDLILLDLHLPDIPGWEVLETLRADPATRDIPVVIISADAMSNRIERLRKAGARDYLTKPLDVPELLTVLREHLQPGAVLASDTLAG